MPYLSPVNVELKLDTSNFQRGISEAKRSLWTFRVFSSLDRVIDGLSLIAGWELGKYILGLLAQ